jgi:hypothetical protein
MNNKVQLKSLTSYLSKTFSACKTLDDLWTACISTTKQVNFEHFSFRIQYPTPFTNPKTTPMEITHSTQTRYLAQGVQTSHQVSLEFAQNT